MQSTIARNGGLAFRWAPVAQVASIRRTSTAGVNKRWSRFYVYFVSLPNITTAIHRYDAAAGGSPHISFRPGTSDIHASITGGATGTTPFVVTTGVWYLIDFKADVSGASAVASLTVNGSDRGSNTVVQAATTLLNSKIGPSCTGALVTADMCYDDYITGTDIADYPVGAGQIVGRFPTSDGSHSFLTAGQFIYNAATGNIDPAAEDTYTYIDHPLSSTIGDFLNAATAATGDYLEWGFGSMASLERVNGVEIVSAHHTADANSNKQTMRVVDAATEVDVFTDADFSNVTVSHQSNHFANAPSNGFPWTKAGLEGMKIRWGSSFTAADVTPDAYIDGLVIEVDYVPLVDSTGSGSPVKTLSKTATGTATQKFTGSGTPTKTLSKTATGTAAARFNASGSPVKTLVLVSAGTSSQKFNASGNPRKTLSMVAVGAANSTGNITGSGNPRKTLSMFATGVATSTVAFTPHDLGGRPRFEIRYHNTPEPKKKRRRPRPMPELVIEAQEAPVTPLEPLQAITRRQVNPETWQKIQTAVQVQEILAKAQATHEPIGDVDLRLLRHFLEMVGSAPELTEDEANMPFMLKRFLRMGK